ncbi:uncharacterized protein LOC126903311 [Daktulosphaira vitifoliae]|uniref:uncharacterized protein LOC126903311 n=1 Tax=Daktulosphaira vitifoliae TaxID=58002 RepID=UPI0021AA1DD0|nr:uncharacterized protein LOC126903311 [Daktulosphaira vitifoliae]
MNNYSVDNDTIHEMEQLYFKINNKQVVFKTDKRTVDKLNDEEVLMNYVKAIINSRMLVLNGQSLINYPVNITRTDSLNTSSPIIELEVSTIVQPDGVEELHCVLLNDGSPDEIKSSNDFKSVVISQNGSDIIPWNDISEAYVPDNAMPALKWSPEMTSLLIGLRGSLNEEFNSSKYKFKLWELIARRMNNEMPSVKVTAKDCDDKWRNIAATYRKNIEKIKYMGDFSVRWEHFSAMDEILRGTDELKKPESYIEVDKLIDNDNLNRSPDTGFIDNDNNQVLNMNSNDDMDYFFLTSTTNANNEIRLWTQEMILLLFSLRHSMADRFDTATKETEKDLLWFDLVTKMNKNLGSNADIESYEAESLWNQCVEQYEENLNKLKVEGPQDVKWPYFAIMDQMLGGTIEIPDVCHPRPGEELVPVFTQGVWKKSEVLDILNNCKFDDNVNMDEDSDQSDDSLAETKSGVKWRPELVRKLIQLRTDAENEVKKWFRKPSSIWTVVLKKFRRLGVLTLTEQDLENKWNSLVRSYNHRVSGISKKSKKQWPYFYGMHSAINTIGNDINSSDIFSNEENKTDRPPEWFLSYMRKKEAVDAYKHEQLKNMLADIQHSQMENRRLILSIFKKL